MHTRHGTNQRKLRVNVTDWQQVSPETCINDTSFNHLGENIFFQPTPGAVFETNGFNSGWLWIDLGADSTNLDHFIEITPTGDRIVRRGRAGGEQ